MVGIQASVGRYARAVGLVGAAGEGAVGDVLLGRPGLEAGGLDGVLRRRGIDRVGDPGVPEGLDVGT